MARHYERDVTVLPRNGNWCPQAHVSGKYRTCRFRKVVSAVERTQTAFEQIVPGPVDFIFIDGDHEFASVVADLYAVRSLISPHTLLYGHDIRNVERWPGVRSAVDWFVQDYHVRANIWVANAGGLAHLQQAPEYGTISDLVNAVQTQQSLRYQDPVCCARFNIATRSSVASSDTNRETGVPTH
ncbi:class I SAM-dependent methyltransferase [Nitrospira calida]